MLRFARYFQLATDEQWAAMSQMVEMTTFMWHHDELKENFDTILFTAEKNENIEKLRVYQVAFNLPVFLMLRWNILRLNITSNYNCLEAMVFELPFATYQQPREFWVVVTAGSHWVQDSLVWVFTASPVLVWVFNHTSLVWFEIHNYWVFETRAPRQKHVEQLWGMSLSELLLINVFELALRDDYERSLRDVLERTLIN